MSKVVVSSTARSYCFSSQYERPRRCNALSFISGVAESCASSVSMSNYDF